MATAATSCLSCPCRSPRWPGREMEAMQHLHCNGKQHCCKQPSLLTREVMPSSRSNKLACCTCTSQSVSCRSTPHAARQGPNTHSSTAKQPTCSAGHRRQQAWHASYHVVMQAALARCD